MHRYMCSSSHEYNSEDVDRQPDLHRLPRPTISIINIVAGFLANPRRAVYIAGLKVSEPC